MPAPLAALFLPVLLAGTGLDREVAGWEAHVARDPDGAVGNARLAAALLARFRRHEDPADAVRAEAAARRSLDRRERGNGEAALRLAESLLAQHRFREALEAAERAIRLQPGRVSPRRLRAELLLELGEYDAFAASLGEWSDAPGDPAVQATLARWEHLTGNTASALRRMRAARDLAARPGAANATRAWYERKLADLAFAAGQTDEPEAGWTRAEALDPDDARARLALARLAAARGQWRTSLERALAAARRLPHPEVLAAVADARLALGDAAGAERLLTRIDACGRSGPAAGNEFDRHLALFWADHGREVERAYELARREVAARPEVWAWDTLAWAAYRAGRLAEARAAAGRALALGTRDPLLLVHTGAVLLAAGDPERGRRLLGQALAVQPLVEGAAEARRLLARRG